MAIKLIKACKELNIGMATALDFAAKQGKEIAADPNVRIDDELYMMLAKAFNKDMAVKMEAERQAQERQEREIPQTVSLKQEAEPEVLHSVQKPKVVGKIDLNTGKPAAEPQKPAAPEPAVEPEPVVEAPKPVAEPEPAPAPEPVKQPEPVAEEP
ncbi:MAG: translation initiation factor IF-2, partial [Bacteroidales bacterium]|nr:translation initiation factor IF-2 [Candidatus Colicola faecequi]